MAWQIISDESGTPGAESTVVVLGQNELAVTTAMALLRELGWASPGARFPHWIDEELESTLPSDKPKALSGLRKRRHRASPHWLVRASAQDETFARMARLVLDPRYLVVVDDGLIGNGSSAWMAGLPEWLLTRVNDGVTTLLVGAHAAVERSSELIGVLAAFVGESDPGKLACAASWVRLRESRPDLPFGTLRFDGAIEAASPQECAGWAFIEGMDRFAELEIQVGGRSVVVTADQPRPDLQELGAHPTGNCGFRCVFPSEPAIAAGDRIHVRVVGGLTELANSPARAQVFDPSRKSKMPVAPADEVPFVELPDLPRHRPRTSSRIFANTLWALLLREIRTRFGTQRASYVWGILEPTAQIVVLTLLVKGIKGRFQGTIYGVDALLFFSIAILPYRMFSQAVSGSRVKAGSGLFNFRQVRPMDLGLINAFVEFMTYGIVMVLLLGAANWAGYDYTIGQPLQLLYCIFLLFWMGFSIGLFFDVLANILPAARFVLSMLMKFMFITSGVFYSIASLPSSIKPYLLWNPVLHIIDEVRASAIPAYPIRGDLNYATEFTVVSLFIALAFYRRNLYRLF